MNSGKITRRFFLMSSAAMAAGCMTAGRKTSRISPNEKLNVAAIGCGGMGGGDIMSCSKTENVVALCDVDWNRGGQVGEELPNAKRYTDFRVMLEKQKDIDAVTVSTPDHTHAIAALTAMQLGKHVRVQKPMTYSIEEARLLTKAAKKYSRLATAMGNQGHAGDGVRQMCEILWSNAIGFVREAHIWTNRPVWPQGIAEPLPAQPVPEKMAWDLWLSVAPERSYNEGYAPFKWRGWWDFGCGALGDMGCHIMDPANWALQLSAPTSVECIQQEGNSDQTGPTKSVIKYEFPARPFRDSYPQAEWYGKTLPPVTVYWYDGGIMPPRPAGVPEDEVLGEGANGSYFVGDDGVATTGCYGGETRLLPKERMDEYTMPVEFIPRILNDGNSYLEWISACKGGTPAGSNFSYSGPFTETVLLGNVAVRAGQKLLWDAKKMKVTNLDSANQYVARTYRKGWELPKI